MLIKRRVGIRNVPNGFTSWIAMEGGEPLQVPPALHTSLYLEVGDLFLQFHVLAASPLRHTVRVWILVEDQKADGTKAWKRVRTGAFDEITFDTGSSVVRAPAHLTSRASRSLSGIQTNGPYHTYLASGGHTAETEKPTRTDWVTLELHVATDVISFC